MSLIALSIPHMRICACNAIRNYIAKARMMKLNPAGNKKFWRNPEMSEIKATENFYNYNNARYTVDH